ncbi:DUF1524 domain-containing protein [Pseudomonas sp. KNUC1026]|uniref:DUF1524 domain-containing protein n=1 Tax=Pseudomonas sp. KNUC1026 TaxID=2893890 RepID=UPI001F456B76|nr:DUF1524 domain-containing protein [Pseudomonas sp. KNUC1026]UFH50133.1 HNH endonuclease family protein [Pseudomonas sp. KNUC1026]
MKAAAVQTAVDEAIDRVGGRLVRELADRVGGRWGVVGDVRPPIRAGPVGDLTATGHRAEFYDDQGRAVNWMNPMTGQLEPVSEGMKLHADHIYPQKEVKKLDGFKELTKSQQNKILNDPYNFQPLGVPENCSKGCRVNGTDKPWDTFRGHKLPDAYSKWLRAEQENMRIYLQEKIKSMSGVD